MILHLLSLDLISREMANMAAVRTKEVGHVSSVCQAEVLLAQTPT